MLCISVDTVSDGQMQGLLRHDNIFTVTKLLNTSMFQFEGKYSVSTIAVSPEGADMYLHQFKAVKIQPSICLKPFCFSGYLYCSGSLKHSHETIKNEMVAINS